MGSTFSKARRVVKKAAGKKSAGKPKSQPRQEQPTAKRETTANLLSPASSPDTNDTSSIQPMTNEHLAQLRTALGNYATKVGEMLPSEARLSPERKGQIAAEVAGLEERVGNLRVEMGMVLPYEQTRQYRANRTREFHEMMAGLDVSEQ